MKVFISHSGDRSRALGEQMRWFISTLIQATDPWLSTGIEKGARWAPELAAQLDGSGFGVVCLTSDNINSRWILFESGALAKKLDGRVATLLLDITPEQVVAPLDQFQHTLPTKDDVWKLIVSISKGVSNTGGKTPADPDLRKLFDDYHWPELEKRISEIRAQAPPTKAPERTERELLTELLDLTRSLARSASVQEKTMRLVSELYESTNRSTAGLDDLHAPLAPSRANLEAPTWRRLANSLSSNRAISNLKTGELDEDAILAILRETAGPEISTPLPLAESVKKKDKK